MPKGKVGRERESRKVIPILEREGVSTVIRQEIEIMQRYEVSPDKATLSCMTELWSGGRTVRHEDVFPLLQKR